MELETTEKQREEEVAIGLATPAVRKEQGVSGAWVCVGVCWGGGVF